MMNNLTIGINSSIFGKFLWISDHDAKMAIDFTLDEAKEFIKYMESRISELESM